MGCGEAVNTSDFDSDIHGFDSRYPCIPCIHWFESNNGCCSNKQINKQMEVSINEQRNVGKAFCKTVR